MKRKILETPYARGRRAGAKIAASVADSYNASTTHGHRLGDCILAKMNIGRTDRPPRLNHQRLQAPDDAWVAGYAVALAELHRWGRDGVNVRSAAAAASITLAQARACKVDPYDLKELKRAGVK